MQRKNLWLVQSALIAAVYAALTYVSSAMGLAYGNVQFRLSEALTILPVFTPAAIPGLAVGCLISNLGSPYMIADMIFGTLATLLAAVCTRLLRKVCIKGVPFLSPLPPVIFNGLIVGLEISYFMPDGFEFVAFLTFAASVAAGELVVCYLLGLPLFAALKKKNLFNEKMYIG